MGNREQRAELYKLLGDLPERDTPLSARLVSEEVRANYILEVLELDLNGIEPVPAYFIKPKSAGKYPTIVYNHSHGGKYEIGKLEVIEPRSGFQNPPYGDALSAMGYNVLCIDHWNFGERKGRTELELFKEMLWHGRVLWGMMVYDSLRSVDYLVTRDDVDESKIAAMGMSMGSTMAWWHAALDERIKCCIDICCLTDFHELINTRYLDGHGIYYYVPGLLKEWTTSSINALIAPRPHLSLAGEYDQLTPPKGLDKIDAELKTVYAKAGAPDAWKLIRYPCGHIETHAMRAEVLAWLDKWLC